MDSSSNDPGTQMPQQSSYTPPPPPPPPQKKGFNWLACCGITCLVLIVIGALLFWGCWQFISPFVGMGVEMAQVGESVTSTDITTIRSAAVDVSTTDLVDTTNVFEGQWLALEGEIIGDFGGSAQFSSGNFNAEDATQYTLEDNIIVLDMSQAPRVALAGDRLRAYGKIAVMDMGEMGKMPFVGQAIEEEMQKDPEMAKNMRMIFFIAKEVEAVAGDSGESAGEEPVEDSEGWVN
jgi:hypothetical protein